MHNFMDFKTRLYVVFKNEASGQLALSFKQKGASSHFETYIKEGQERNIYTFI